jgi:hypothetical protein
MAAIRLPVVHRTRAAAVGRLLTEGASDERAAGCAAVCLHTTKFAFARAMYERMACS